MSALSSQTKPISPLIRLGGFLFSLIVGLFAGMFVFNNTALLEQTAVILGITEKTAWHFTRSSGTVAYLLITASTVWGLLLSSKIIKETVPAMLSLAMHNFLSWSAIGITALHMIALLFDSYFTYTAADLLVPFIGPYRPGWVGLGIIGYYLMLFTSISFYFRKQIGQKRWRKLHYLTFGAYLLATIHGIMAGTDSGLSTMKMVYWGSGLLVLFLTNYRILTAKMSTRRARRVC